MVLLGVCGDARNNSGSETLKVAVVLVITNVVTPAEAHYLKASSSHCDLAGHSGSPSAASFDKVDYLRDMKLSKVRTPFYVVWANGACFGHGAAHVT
jgi:hypothetical protein